jgi:hypothetical protein
MGRLEIFRKAGILWKDWKAGKFFQLIQKLESWNFSVSPKFGIQKLLKKI